MLHALTGNHLGRAGDRNAARYVAAKALKVPEPFVVLLSMWPTFQALVTRSAARVKFRSGTNGPYVFRLPAIYDTQVDPVIFTSDSSRLRLTIRLFKTMIS